MCTSSQVFTEGIKLHFIDYIIKSKVLILFRQGYISTNNFFWIVQD